LRSEKLRTIAVAPLRDEVAILMADGHEFMRVARDGAGGALGSKRKRPGALGSEDDDSRGKSARRDGDGDVAAPRGAPRFRRASKPGPVGDKPLLDVTKYSRGARAPMAVRCHEWAWAGGGGGTCVAPALPYVWLPAQGVHDVKLKGRLAAREAETRRLAEAAAATELLLTEEAG
jgi:hypothetical protein